MLADQRYCCPLTITDAASRYLLSCEALSSTRGKYAPVSGRGRRHRRAERELVLAALTEAQSAGARLAQACRFVGLSARISSAGELALMATIVDPDLIAGRAMHSHQSRKRRS
jgi:hypothetical protein